MDRKDTEQDRENGVQAITQKVMNEIQRSFCYQITKN